MLAMTTSAIHSGRGVLECGQILGALFSMPWVSLILAAIIVVGLAVSPRHRVRGRSRLRLIPTASAGIVARYSPEHRTLGTAAIALIIVFLAENLITGYALNLQGVVSWWRYATPLFTASVGVTVLLAIIVTRGSTPPEHPVVSARRTWLSFSSPAGATGAALALLILAATTILAGLASSNLNGGPYVYLAVEVPNETIDPVRPWFYGWAYGIPVLICILAIAAITVAALHANSARAFLRPDTVVAEQRERRDIATGISRIVTSAALLALAGAWRFIADAGSITELTVEGDGRSDSYTVFWRYGEIAATGGWLAPVLEVVAFVLLFMMTAQLSPRRYDTEQTPTEAPADREAAQ